jgi:hypothetical protein
MSGDEDCSADYLSVSKRNNAAQAVLEKLIISGLR